MQREVNKYLSQNTHTTHLVTAFKRDLMILGCVLLSGMAILAIVMLYYFGDSAFKITYNDYDEFRQTTHTSSKEEMRKGMQDTIKTREAEGRRHFEPKIF